MEKTELILNLTKIETEANSNGNGYHYRAAIKDWEKNDKSRTYFSITETRENSRHYVKKDYGYIDNITGEYVAGNGHLDGTLFTFSGSKL